MELQHQGATHYFRTVRTGDDGACAVHSVFGKPSCSGLKLPHARTFVASAFGSTAQDFCCRIDNHTLVREFEMTLWSDMLKPKAKLYAGLNMGAVEISRETNLVWDEVCKHHIVLEACVDAVLREDACYLEFTSYRHRICEAFGSLCTPALKDVFVKRLLISVG